jgi:hypothetical protein
MTQQIPEALGPGVDQPDGSVTYGHARPANVVIDPPRPAWERDRDMAAAHDAARCPRCLDVPDDVIVPIARALREAARTNRIPR